MSDKLIFHVDVNSAFLSWEAVFRMQNGISDVDLRTIVSAIGGDQEKRHGIILAKSAPAKKYNIITGEPITNALKKCPNLTVVPPRMGIYKKYSDSLFHLLSEYAPVIEKFSIDEAYLDMTGTQRLYGTPEETAYMLKDLIKEKLEFTVNIGISTNKLLAKMAGDFSKPDKVHTLFPKEIESKMWPLPVQDLLFVGKSTADRLRGLGIFTIGDLASANLDMLNSQFGSACGTMLHQYSNGISSDEVHSSQAETGEPLPHEYKNYGNSTTLPSDVTTVDAAFPVLLSLCEHVCARLRKDDKKASCITIFYTTANFIKESHQKSLSSPTNITTEIFNEVKMLFVEKWDGQTPLRLLGVRASKVGNDSVYQYNLFHDPVESASSLLKHDKLAKLDKAVDSIRTRYGEESIKRSSLIQKKGGQNVLP